jgi:hypothetical protein
MAVEDDTDVGAERDESAWSVARLNDEIEATLESASNRFPTYVVGEVSDATAKGYGTFFTLRDVDDEVAADESGPVRYENTHTRRSAGRHKTRVVHRRANPMLLRPEVSLSYTYRSNPVKIALFARLSPTRSPLVLDHLPFRV